MAQEIITIDFGGVNCYLVNSGQGFILIDNGIPAKRAYLDSELKRAGCKPGNLELILLTHGDHDHAGNCAYLREKYGAKIAMHIDDLGMVEQGDMGWNRKVKPDKTSALFRIIAVIAPLFNPGKFETFSPDLTVDEESGLSSYGFDAKILHLPGHSKGSIGILTDNGDLICGDLIYNFFGKPSCLSINDLSDLNQSLEKLKKLNIKTVYPGHGKPFPMTRFKS